MHDTVSLDQSDNNVMTDNSKFFSLLQKQYLKYDLIAGTVVFLVAIPLCLGIAQASGAPLFSGLLAGIIGGIVVGSLSPSHVSVSGPAAGMVVIVLAAISNLGSFNTFLLAVFFSGIIQILVGLMRIGFVVEYVPSNVIQGLLSAIGILIIIKQIPLAFTHAASMQELMAHLQGTADSFHYGPLKSVFTHINTGAVTISVISLALLIYCDKTRISLLKLIPGPILVVLLGIAINELSTVMGWYITQDSPQLVNIPLSEGLTGLVAQMEYPMWQQWQNPMVYFYALLIAAIGSLETLLNLKASEKLDLKKRRCSKDRELIAQGFGNSLAGLIGALPVTSVIVRSSVNIQAGAKSKVSAVLHGILILLSVMLLPHWLNEIPLASLAAILIHVGYKLAKPAVFRDMYKQGLERFCAFIITLVAIVVFNILTGILIGIAASVFHILKSNSQARLDIINEIHPTGEISRIVLPQYATFLNKASLMAELDSIKKETKLIIDARYATYIDEEIIQLVDEFKRELAPQKNISINLLGFKDRYEIHDHIDFINVTTLDAQESITPEQALTVLREGNQRFISEQRIHRTLKSDVRMTSRTQHPIAVVLGCIDSRVPVETIFDLGFGDIFCIRVAGNIVNDDVLASMEYACGVVGAKLLVILGHTKCGAIDAACDSFEQGLITQLLAKITPAIEASGFERDNKSEQAVMSVTEYNIANTLNQVMSRSETLKRLIESNQCGITGGVYDVVTGKVEFKDYAPKMTALNPDVGAVKLLY